MLMVVSHAVCCRYHIHVAAESWGLGHKSHNEDSGERVIKVRADRDTGACQRLLVMFLLLLWTTG